MKVELRRQDEPDTVVATVSWIGGQPVIDTEDDILRMIGPPREKAHFPRQNQTAWDWKYVDSWGYPSIFSVMFDANGVVVSKFSRRLERERWF